eukprot:366244-Chlamydomonas_euryale.AAC.13
MNANQHYGAAFSAALTDPRKLGSVAVPSSSGDSGGSAGGLLSSVRSGGGRPGELPSYPFTLCHTRFPSS